MEADMTIRADTEDLKIDSSDALNLRFILLTVGGDILRETIRDMKAACGHVDIVKFSLMYR